MDPVLLLDTENLIATMGLPLATLVYCFLSGFIPIFNTEVYLVGIAAFTSWASLPLLAVMAGAGQMIAKAGIYLAGRGTLEIPLGKYEEKRQAWIERIEQREAGAGGLVLLSAFVGWPPFYAISAVAGAVAMNLPIFLGLGMAGRTARFGLILALGGATWGWFL